MKVTIFLLFICLLPCLVSGMFRGRLRGLLNRVARRNRNPSRLLGRGVGRGRIFGMADRPDYEPYYQSQSGRVYPVESVETKYDWRGRPRTVLSLENSDYGYGREAPDVVISNNGRNRRVYEHYDNPW